MKKIFYFLTMLLINSPSYSSEAITAQEKKMEHYVTVADNVNLRVTFIPAAKAPLNDRKKVIILLPGRASFFEKNIDIAESLCGYDQSNTVLPKVYCDFWCIDYRGHGKSDGRLTRNDQRCHIDSFQTYVDDLDKVLKSLIKTHYQNQKNTEYYLLAGSFGGVIALKYIQDYKFDTIAIKKTLLVSPMIRFKIPYPRWLTKLLVNFMSWIGYEESYAIGYKDLDLSKADFSKFKAHHNEKDFHETNKMLSEHPDLITSGPTYGWAKAAFEAENDLDSLKSLPNQTIAFLAGQDAELDIASGKVILEKLGVQIKEYPKSGHNLFKETEEYAPGFTQDLFNEIAK